METIDKLSNAAEEAAERISSATSHAAEALGEKGEQLMNMEAQLMEDCRDYIREHPIASVGIALAAGFMLSQITTYTYEHRR